MNKIIEIQPQGSYFQTDNEGFLINPTSDKKLQREWIPLINDVIEVYKHQFGKDLVNVYIRGSVAKGEAIPNVSDIDSFAFVTIPKDNVHFIWTRHAAKILTVKYPFANGIECDVFSIDEIANKNILLIQSLCVYGKPIVLPKMKAGKTMALHAPGFSGRMKRSYEKLETEASDEKLKETCVWIMKGLLRTGFEITMERSKTYTRDLYLCYKTFSEFYPEKEAEMKKVLYYALNPTTNRETIRKILNTFGSWLLQETQSQF